MKKQNGITLIALVITIIILIILAGVAINLGLGENGLVNRAKVARDETTKQTATEKMNLKITSKQMDTYAKERRMPTLKELSLELKNDDEIAYVTEESKVASTIYEVGDNPTTIYTKLNDYPYEFEINSSLQLASIDGVKTSNTTNVSYDENIYDNWTTWLKLAGIENPNTYNGKDILSDSALMENVMNNEKALRYLAKSKYFLLPAVYNSATAYNKLMTSTKLVTVPTITEENNRVIYDGMYEEVMGESGIVKNYHAFDDNEDTYAGSVNNGENNIGAWIGYDFEMPVNVFKVTGKIRMKSYKIQYSDDLTTWNDALEKSLPGTGTGDEFSETITKNVGIHRYWRLYVSGGQQYSNWGAIVWSLQFYGVK